MHSRRFARVACAVLLCSLSLSSARIVLIDDISGEETHGGISIDSTRNRISHIVQKIRNIKKRPAPQQPPVYRKIAYAPYRYQPYNGQTDQADRYQPYRYQPYNGQTDQADKYQPYRYQAYIRQPYNGQVYSEQPQRVLVGTSGYIKHRTYSIPAPYKPPTQIQVAPSRSPEYVHVLAPVYARPSFRNRTRVQELKSRLTRVLDAIDAINREREETETYVMGLHSKKQALATALSEASREESTLNSSLQLTKGELESIQTELERLKGKIGDIKDKLNALMRKKGRIREEISNAEKGLREQTDSSLNHQLECLKQEYKSLHAEYLSEIERAPGEKEKAIWSESIIE